MNRYKPGSRQSGSLVVSQVGLTFGFLAGFFLVIAHSHYLMHLDIGITAIAAVLYVVAVILGLLTNLWFMAGQPIVLQALALFEPTSCIMEWLHDSIFGISQDRLDEAYSAGAQKRRIGKDGREYIELVIPRRRTPYPLSLGGLLHLLFFSAEDPFDPAMFVPHAARTVMIMSTAVLVLETAALEYLYSPAARHAAAVRLHRAGDLPGAVRTYQALLHQAPDYDPFVAAAHHAHLARAHPWAAGTYLAAANAHARGDLAAAAAAYRRVLDMAPDCPLAAHPARALAPHAPSAHRHPADPDPSHYSHPAAAPPARGR